MKKEGRSAILSISSAAAPLGDGSIAERSYRGEISDVDPHPARLNLRAQRCRLRSLWLNPALCGSPVYRREAKSRNKNCLRAEYLLCALVEVLRASLSDALRMAAVDCSDQGLKNRLGGWDYFSKAAAELPDSKS